MLRWKTAVRCPAGRNGKLVVVVPSRGYMHEFLLMTELTNTFNAQEGRLLLRDIDRLLARTSGTPCNSSVHGWIKHVTSTKVHYDR